MRPHRKNPKIAKVFSQMGIVEELGSGMRKMFKYTPLYANGKEPVIEEQDVYRIEIPYIPTLQGSEIDTAQKSTQKRLDLIRENPYVTTQEMADSIGIIRRTIAKHIRSLQNRGIIKRVGPDKGGHWEVIDGEERRFIDIIAEAFRYGLDPTDEKQRRMVPPIC